MSHDLPEENSRPPYPWLPYVAALVGVIVSLIVWYFQLTKPHALTDYEDHWIIMGQSFLLVLLIALAIRLTQVTRQSKKSFEIINAHFKKEIAERLHTEESKQKLEKALLQGQKLQAIGTLAGGIAHDFNNILYAVIGYVEMSREDVAKDSLVYKNLGKVLEGAKRGQELIARILDFSRRQHHDFNPLLLIETIEGVLSLLKPTIPASVSISFDSPREDCKIMGNQTQLHQVFVNIINNAVDAMDGEGNIAIKVDRVTAADNILKQFPGITSGNYCKIEISDTGHGMDQTTIERIFEPFFTTKEVGKGTGLGLSTVHTIIKDHQGEIIATSQLGHGAKFTILLPESREDDYGKNTFS